MTRAPAQPAARLTPGIVLATVLAALLFFAPSAARADGAGVSSAGEAPATPVQLAAEAPATSVEACPRVLLYFARGSGQSLSVAERGLARPGLQLYRALTALYGTGAVGSIADGYTAVGLTFTLPVGKLALLNPFVAGSYGPSVSNGVQVATQNIADMSALCPHSWLVLGGYSQGAQVIRTTLPGLDEEEQRHVAAVVLFGDPYFSSEETNVSRFPIEAPARKGLLRKLGKAIPIPPSYDGRVFSWCHPRDLVCDARFKSGTAAHENYDLDAAAAAEQIAARLGTLGLAPPSGSLAGHPYRVAGTCVGGTCGLAEWSGPGARSFERVGAVYEGQVVQVVCQVVGESIVGANERSSPVWDRLSDRTFVSDFYLNTPGVGEFSPALPRCPALAVSTSVPAP